MAPDFYETLSVFMSENRRKERHKRLGTDKYHSFGVMLYQRSMTDLGEITLVGIMLVQTLNCYLWIWATAQWKEVSLT